MRVLILSIIDPVLERQKIELEPDLKKRAPCLPCLSTDCLPYSPNAQPN